MNTNTKQEEQVVDAPQPGDDFEKIRREAALFSMRHFISEQVDDYYAQRKQSPHEEAFSLLNKHRQQNNGVIPPQPTHHILPTIAAGRLGKMIRDLPPVQLKESGKKK